jgi:flagellar biosynthetic protein FlhB
VLVTFLDRPEDMARLFASAGAGDAMMALLGAVAVPALSLVAAPAAVIFALLLAQGSFVFVPQRVLPKPSRLSPVENAKNKYGVRGLVEFAKSTVKLGALVAVLAIALWGETDRLPQYSRVDARFIGHLLEHQFWLISTGVLIVAAGLAFFDLVWQRFDHLKRMRMSHQELKEEGKQAEGDPFIKSQRRERARQIANNRMLLEVPKADVVVTNPTHYAVALKWQRHGGSTPVCVAKGMDDIALAIRARAVEAGVPVRSDPPTARSIHALVEIGQEIRPEHYQAVAAAIIFADEMRREARRASYGGPGSGPGAP